MEYGKKHRKTISWQVAQEILVIICNYCRVSIFVVDEASKSACGACASTSQHPVVHWRICSWVARFEAG